MKPHTDRNKETESKVAEQVERLAVVETDVKNVKEIVKRIEDKFDAAVVKFVTQEQLTAMSDGLEAKLKALSSTRWRDALLQALAFGGVGALVTFFFTH